MAGGALLAGGAPPSRAGPALEKGGSQLAWVRGRGRVGVGVGGRGMARARARARAEVRRRLG